MENCVEAARTDSISAAHVKCQAFQPSFARLLGQRRGLGRRVHAPASANAQPQAQRFIFSRVIERLRELHSVVAGVANRPQAARLLRHVAESLQVHKNPQPRIA
jgi:hypothetical protein